MIFIPSLVKELSKGHWAAYFWHLSLGGMNGPWKVFCAERAWETGKAWVSSSHINKTGIEILACAPRAPICSMHPSTHTYPSTRAGTALNTRNYSRGKPQSEILHCCTFHRLYAHPTHSGLSERRPNLCDFKFILGSELANPTGKQCSAVLCFQLPQCWFCSTADL